MYKETTIKSIVPSSFERIKVADARYLNGYSLRIRFNDRKETVVDFSKFLQHKAKGYLSKYRKVEDFKNFKIENGNVVWGKNWDLVFPINQLYQGEIKD